MKLKQKKIMIIHTFGLSLNLVDPSFQNTFDRLGLEFPKWVDFFKEIRAVWKRRKLLNELPWLFDLR